MRLVVSGIFTALAVAILASSGTLSVGGEKPKATIKQVMKVAHKSGLLKKVATGKANEEEVKKLVGCYTALSQNKSPAGKAEDWKERTGKMLKLAKSAKAGTPIPALQKAANCKGCHEIHKQ